jgi:hypothetical protein
MAEFSDEEYGLEQEDKDLLASLSGAAPEVETAPPLLDEPDAAPVMEGPQLDPTQELPGGVLDQVAETPSPVPDEPLTPATSEATIRKQGGLEKEQAQANIDVAQQQSEFATQHNMDLRLAHADYLERRQRAEQDLDRKVKELDAAKVTDPRSQDKWKNRIAVVFGALGAGGGTNQGLEAVQKKWHDDTERQKVNIGLLQDRVTQARTGVKDADEGRRQLTDAANAQLISNYNTAIKQGELQLKKLGIPAAEIAQDQRLQKLQAGKAAAVQLARKQQDEHELAQARIRLMAAQAGKAARKGAGGGGGNAAAEAKVTEMAEAGRPLSEITSYAAANGVKPKDARAIKASVDLARGRESKDNEGDSKNEVFDPATGKSYGNAPTPARAGKATDDLKLIQGLRGDMQALKRHLNDPATKGVVAPFGMSAAARERDSLTKAAIVKLSAFNNLGAISADDRRLLESIVNGGVSALLGLGDKQIDHILSILDDGQKTVLNVQGLNKGSGKKPEQVQGSPAPANGGPSDSALDAEARKILADPGSYSPKARAKAAAHLKAKLKPIVL